ncbi:Major royal jelly protein [Methylobacterium sp. UNC300MFChir4.1]|uniref:SMP-30/gluconolactonase/LRE family protein n=1 Tax=Methylobacterium sp. UNC300MFChir4.1 TaxID=1502747 RepID=UPI0008C03B37|nr:L-dopachrome tautomerase-related protein [Methylobacterium sp. UNC300MFChir4.1]SEP26054.1 Major royal jelly protein [Methylobacterium sp. UNC300MFChir4.1]
MRATLLALLLAAGLGAPGRAAEAPAGSDALKPMVESNDLVFNGITRSADGRLFSPFQRQSQDKGIELGEWRDGKAVPYPDAAWNAWKTGDDPAKAFVAVNAIRIGPDGDLWVVDKGAPGMGAAPLPGGPKLVQIDLATNAVRRVYPLQAATTEKSFIDDFRFNGGHIYLTDAGQPGLIVLDRETGGLRRVLDGHWSTIAQRPLTGQGRVLRDDKDKLLFIHADQLEVSPDGKTFYYQACTGPLYSIETRYLDDASVSDDERAKHVKLHAATVATGGTAIDAGGTIYASDTDGLRILKIAPDGTVSTLVQDPRLVWVDAMWIDEQGGLWIPAAQMNRTPAMSGGAASTVKFPTTIYRMQIDAEPLRN